MNPKLKYGAQEKPYTEDINDLVEKGGVGSGVRGHKTAKKQGPNKESQLAGNMAEAYKQQMGSMNEANKRVADAKAAEKKAKSIPKPPEISGFKVVDSKEHESGGHTYMKVSYEAKSSGMESKYDEDDYRDELHEMATKHYGSSFQLPNGMHTNRISSTSVGWDTEKKKHIVQIVVKVK